MGRTLAGGANDACSSRVSLTDEERAEAKRRVLKFLQERRQPVLLITTGLDGKPKLRLMGAHLIGFTI
jgi:hypothetical protein